MKATGTHPNICSNHYTPDTGWGTPQLIENNMGNAEYPQVAIDPAGNAIAVWRQQNGAIWNIWSNLFR